MQTVELESRKAKNSWWAVVDARQRSYVASTHYSDSEKLEAERVKMMLEMAYYGKIYLNYRQKFIVLKAVGSVQNPELLAELEADYEERGYTKVVTEQGVIYRIPKRK